MDSNSGIPRRESMAFAAAIAPMLLMDRFRQFELEHDQMVLLAAAIYFGVRFLGAKLIGKFSVHRGMWHSIPAILIFAGLAYLASNPSNVFDRYLKAIAVGLGALSHLVLDEVYSVDTSGVVPRFKKSFGTAVKFWGKDPWANFSTYTKLAIVSLAVLTEPMVFERLEQRNPEAA
ncbi:MAG: metal-dependent hydrolase, partial [Actinomycetota bacterium]